MVRDIVGCNDARIVLIGNDTDQRPTITHTPYVLPNPARLPIPDQGGRAPGIPMQSRDWHSGHSDGLATISAGHDPDMYGPSSTVAFLRSVMPGQGSGASTPMHHDTRNHYSTPDARSSAPAAPAPDRMVSIVLPCTRTQLTPLRYEQTMEGWLFFP